MIVSRCSCAFSGKGSLEEVFGLLCLEFPIFFDLVPAKPFILTFEFAHTDGLATDYDNIDEQVLDGQGYK